MESPWSCVNKTKCEFSCISFAQHELYLFPILRQPTFKFSVLPGSSRFIHIPAVGIPEGNSLIDNFYFHVQTRVCMYVYFTALMERCNIEGDLWMVFFQTNQWTESMLRSCLNIWLPVVQFHLWPHTCHCSSLCETRSAHHQRWIQANQDTVGASPRLYE